MSDIKINEFSVTGMTCSACSSHVEKSVCAISGVNRASVNLLAGTMSVEHSSDISTDDIISAVISAGYGASVKGASAPDTPQKQHGDEEILKIRFFLSLCFLLPLMYIAMGRMWGLPGTAIFNETEFLPAFVITQLLLTLPVIFINFKFFEKGVKAAIHKSPNMDTLVSTGSLAALIYGIYSLYAVCYHCAAGNPLQAHKVASNLYFESSAMILTLITLGKFLEAKAKKRTFEAVNSLLKLIPDTARIIKNGKEQTVPSSSLMVGDEIIVKTGENIPCDGVIIKGNGNIDESAITGESMPVEKNIGDHVTGATLLSGGYIHFKAESVGNDTVFSKIIHLVQSAAADKAPIARTADKVCAVFVPVVMAISLITFAAWFIYSHSVSTALNYAISVLVISCPCALGLATPTAIMAGTGKGAKMGLLFKNAETLEILHNVNTLVTDKTGTLTKGKAEVTDILPAEGITADTLLLTAASIESKSEHPLSQAIMKRAHQLPLLNITEFAQVRGRGIQGKSEDGFIIAGNDAYMEENGIKVSSYENFKNEGKTILHFALSDKYLGAIAISDAIREESADTVKLLKKLGVQVIMLTGDNELTARGVAEKTGINKVIAQVTPDKKQDVIINLKNEGNIVAMVGDGVNDAPSLAAADIGIAIGGATDTAINSADVILIHDKFSQCLDAIHLSRAVIKNIRQNLFWAFFYNALGIPLAAGVFMPLWGIGLNPMIGSLAMSISSLFVVTNSLRLRYFKSKLIKTEVKAMKKTMKIKGMMCTHCTGRTQQALNALDGVSAVVDLTDGGTAFITLEKEVSDELLIKTVTDAGYEVISLN